MVYVVDMKEGYNIMKKITLMEKERKGILYIVLFTIILAIIRPFIGPYWSFIVAYGLIISIVGLGFNLLLGYNGLLSFGHAGMFGIGMYTLGLCTKYFNISSLEILILLSIVVGLIIIIGLGYVASKLIIVYFALFMLSFGQIIFALTYKLYGITGGSDGLSIPILTILNINFNSRIDFLYCYYYFVLLIFAICTIFMWILVNSPFGKTLQAIKIDDIRATYIGIPVRKYRYIAFIISTLYAVISGALYGPLNGFIYPELISHVFSGEIVYLTLLGGMNYFAGPIVGSFIYTILKVYIPTITEYWQFIMGATLIIMILLFPGGIVGWIYSKFKKR